MNQWLKNKKRKYAMIMGHRGARRLAPENTLAGICEGLKYNVDLIEIDIHVSKDNKLIVMHDFIVDTTTNGKGSIFELNSKYIKTLDAGIKFSKKFKNERVPFLEEVLELLNDKKVRLNIEIKNAPIIYKGIEEKVIKILHLYNYQEKVLISSFDHLVLEKIKQIDKKIDTAILYSERLFDIEEYVKGLKLSAIHPHYYWVTKDLIDKMHKLRIAVNTWIINDWELFKKYSQMGVDCIGTDYPNRMSGF